MKKMIIMFFMLFLPVICSAPHYKHFVLFKTGVIKPFEPLLQAVSIVESNNNNFAVNEKEGAYGALQIRQCRIEHFNMLSGKNYTLEDMFNYEKAKEVFLYFASMYSPYQLETIARKWNGSGKMTEVYWNKVKKLL